MKKISTILATLLLLFTGVTTADAQSVWLHGENFDKEGSNPDLYVFKDAEGFMLQMNSRDVNKTPCSWTDPNGVAYNDGINFKNNDPGTISVPDGKKVYALEIGGCSQSDNGNLCFLYTVDKDDVNFFTEPIGSGHANDNAAIRGAKYVIEADGNAPTFALLDFTEAPATKSVKVVFSGSNQENVWFKIYTTAAAANERLGKSGAAANTTMAYWSFNNLYTIKDGVGTPNATAVTSNGGVNLHNVALLPNEAFLPSDAATLTAYRPTRGADDVASQDDKGAYHEVNAINCDGAALHMTSPAPTPETASNSYAWGDKTENYPNGKSYSYQNPFNYFEIEANTLNYKQDMQLELKAAGHNSHSQYYAIAYSTDKSNWTIVSDTYLTGASYNQWVNTTVNLPVGKQEKVYIRIFPAKNWLGGGASVNGNNQFDLDDVWLRGELDVKLAAVSSISIDGKEVEASEKYDFEYKLPKSYTAATTTIRVAAENAKVKVSVVEEDSDDDVDVTDNGDGTYTFETPKANSADLITIRLTAEDDAVLKQARYRMRLFHAGELELSKLAIDGLSVSADQRKALNADGKVTISGNVYTALPVITATANDGTTPEATSKLEGTTATYTIAADDRTFTIVVEGVYIFTPGEKDVEVSLTYSADGKSSYKPEGQWTDGWTNGLYTLRTTSLDGWGGSQFKFNAADNLLEVPGGVVVKAVTFVKYGANYGDGEGITSMSSEGATFRIPTKHGYQKAGRDNLTVVVENHKPGAPIAFTITGGGQPYAQFLLVIEKTNPGTAPKLMNQSVIAANNHAIIDLTFDREMAASEVAFDGKEARAKGGGVALTFRVADLDFAKDYTFTLPAGKAEDLFGNKTTEDITVNFATEARKAVEKKAFDYVVGTPAEFTEAIKAIGSSSDKALERVTIFMKNGDYDFGNNNEQRVNRGNVSIIGQSRNGVTIRGVRDGISNPILNLRDREGFYLQDMTLQNDHDFGRNEGVIQAVAVYGGNKTIMKNVRMHGNQDTQVTGERAYFDKCEIHGMVDFICGGGNNFYDQCDLVIENRGGCVIAAPNNSPEWGYVFSGCTIKAADNAPLATDGSYYLGRPWQPVPRIYYINTKMELLPAAEGWTSMGTMETHFYEYGSVDKDGKEIDLSVRKNSPTSTNTYVPTITADEAKDFTVFNVLSGNDGWLPTDYTQLTDAPVASVDDNGKITWNDDDQVRCYVIFKDGEYVANTIDTSYQATEKGIYTIRSANSMGGLSTAEARIAYGVADGISTAIVDGVPAEGVIYNLAGQKVNASYKGVVIKNGKTVVQK